MTEQIAGMAAQIAELRSERELARSEQAEADAANRAKSEFLANMSHELRTPLNAICGYSQLLEHVAGSALNPIHRDYLGNIVRSAAVLLEMINEVLEFAKLEAGQISIAVEAHNVFEILEDAVADMKAAADQQGICLHVAPIAASLPAVSVDKARLSQILRNLISNGIKYNRVDGEVRIDVSRPMNGKVRIEVADTGWGISPELAGNLFQPYNRLGAERGAIEGTGLGLALCKRLAEMMQAEIGYTTSRDGSSFWIDLPVHASKQTNSSEPSGPGVDDTLLQGRRILYADDIQLNRDLMREVVTNLTRAELTCAPTGVEAWDLIVSNDYDIIILDIHLPELSGYELLSRIRQVISVEVPVLALSAAAMKQDIARGLGAGFTDYWTKPFVPAAFVRKLCEVLGPRHGDHKRHDRNRTPTILVVEDEPVVRSIIVEQLTEASYTVEEADTGSSALTALARRTPDAMVIDFALPGINGHQVARRARQEVPGLPIVMISGFAQPAVLQDVAGPPITALIKPFTQAQLCAAVDRALAAEG